MKKDTEQDSKESNVKKKTVEEPKTGFNMELGLKSGQQVPLVWPAEDDPYPFCDTIGIP